MYSELANGQSLPDVFGKRARADIVVSQKSPHEDASLITKYIIEVKRGSAPTKEIDTDLRRLAEIARLTQGVRTMLFVVSEAKRLKRFITDEGLSVNGAYPIPDDVGHYRVRRTAKAIHAVTTIEKAQYASLLEVYPVPPLNFKVTAKPKLAAKQKQKKKRKSNKNP